MAAYYSSQTICPSVSSKCRLHTAADHCFQHANGNETTIVPLFSNLENNGLQPVHSLFCADQYVLLSLVAFFAPSSLKLLSCCDV